jgi:hypothetical protein
MAFEISNSIREQVNRYICEAANCNNEATEKIEVSAGKHGIIELSVCKNCVSKFKEGQQ